MGPIDHHTAIESLIRLTQSEGWYRTDKFDPIHGRHVVLLEVPSDGPNKLPIEAHLEEGKRGRIIFVASIRFSDVHRTLLNRESSADLRWDIRLGLLEQCDFRFEDEDVEGGKQTTGILLAYTKIIRDSLDLNQLHESLQRLQRSYLWLSWTLQRAHERGVSAHISP